MNIKKIGIWLFAIFSTINLSCSPTKLAIKKTDKAVSMTSPHFVIGHVVSKYNVALDKKDTVYVKETIQKAETLVSVSEIVSKDTVYIEKQINNATVRLVKVRDTLKVGAECRIDTVIIERHYDYTKIAQDYNKILSDRIRKECGASAKFKYLFLGVALGWILIFLIILFSRFARI